MHAVRDVIKQKWRGENACFLLKKQLNFAPIDSEME
jgi:hypothetical protein